MKVLVTGAAGFIGAALCQQLLQRGDTVVGVDNFTPYYDVSLKHARISNTQASLNQHASAAFEFQQLDIADNAALRALFVAQQFDVVVNLAAQPGVRYSLENPHAYIQSNIVGFTNILEACRHNKIKHLVYASSSSVYGNNGKTPFSESDAVDHPISLYAATKKSNELLAHTYAHLYNIPCTGLRFFTVYGPWGRPDMAPFKFTQKILNDEPIDVYNHGDLMRDFTYIDDIVSGIINVIDQPSAPDTEWSNMQPAAASSSAPFRIYNIGNSQPVRLMTFIETLEQVCGKSAEKNYLPMQPGDVSQTHADMSRMQIDFGFNSQTPLADGLQYFVDWYREYSDTLA
jgi:UDP-glucuronate 4-epimerase